MLLFGWDLEVEAWSIFWRWNLSKICVWTCEMTHTSNFGKLNSTLGLVVPLAIFLSQKRSHNIVLFWDFKRKDGLYQRAVSISMKIYPCKVHCRAVRVIEIKTCVGRFVSKVFVPPRHDWFPERLETTCQISFVVKWHFRKRLIDRKKANLLESEPCDVWGLLKLSRKLNPVRKLETSQFDLEYYH